MKIRFAGLNDIETLVKVRFDYFAAENWKISDEICAKIKSELPIFYNAHLNSDFFAVFAEENSIVMSMAFLSVAARPANPDFITGKTGMVLNVLTYPEYRHRGYALAVMEALIEKAKTENLSYLELSASHMGKPLYEKLGFTVLPQPEGANMKLDLC